MLRSANQFHVIFSSRLSIHLIALKSIRTIRNSVARCASWLQLSKSPARTSRRLIRFQSHLKFLSGLLNEIIFACNIALLLEDRTMAADLTGLSDEAQSLARVPLFKRLEP